MVRQSKVGSKICLFRFAALPPHSAVRLSRTGQSVFGCWRLRLRLKLPRQSLGGKINPTAKAQPFRTVRRQSRKPVTTFIWRTAFSSWSAQADGVIVDDGRELFLVGTDSGTLVNGGLRKLSNRPAESP